MKKIGPPPHFLQQERHSNLKTKCPSLCRSCSSRTLRHYIPLRQRAGHLCVHKVGLELAFSLDIDDASARAHVAQSLKDAAGLLCHLAGEPHKDSLSKLLLTGIVKYELPEANQHADVCVVFQLAGSPGDNLDKCCKETDAALTV